VSEPSDLARVASLLTTRLYGRSLEVLAETGSTNDDARAAAERGVPRGHVVVADAQRSGRGARGAVWSSPPGSDLYVSIVERLELAPRDVATLTLAVGLGVREACAALLSARGAQAPVTVKWPNDVRIGERHHERKCAGILVESSSMGDKLGPIVIGIGLDVNRTQWPPELESIATSLRDACGGALDRAEVLATLLGRVESAVDRLAQNGAAAVIAELREHLAMVGDEVEIDGRAGTLAGIDDDGLLLVREGAQLRRVASGTLRRRG